VVNVFCNNVFGLSITRAGEQGVRWSWISSDVHKATGCHKPFNSTLAAQQQTLQL